MERDKLETVINLLDGISVALAVEDSLSKNISSGVFDAVAKATSILEAMYYTEGNMENGYEQQEMQFD